MIISQNINPKNSLYVIGANLIRIMSVRKNKNYDLIFLYEEYQKLYNKNISLNNVLYGLDWLYLLNIISYNEEKGFIQKCF